MRPKAQSIREMIRWLRSMLPSPNKSIVKHPIVFHQRFGIDGTGCPSSKAMRTAGVSFFCGYLSTVGNPKNLARVTASRLRKDGFDIVTVFETTAERARQGASVGHYDGLSALSQLKAIGAPKSAPVYFAVDYAANPQEVFAYFRGLKSAMPVSQIGAYGDYRIIKALFDAGLITYGWQTYAWSAGAWDNRAQLRQFSNDHTIGGIGVDFDRALSPNFGQWPR